MLLSFLARVVVVLVRAVFRDGPPVRWSVAGTVFGVSVVAETWLVFVAVDAGSWRRLTGWLAACVLICGNGRGLSHLLESKRLALLKVSPSWGCASRVGLPTGC